MRSLRLLLLAALAFVLIASTASASLVVNDFPITSPPTGTLTGISVTYPEASDTGGPYDSDGPMSISVFGEMVGAIEITLASPYVADAAVQTGGTASAAFLAPDAFNDGNTWSNLSLLFGSGFDPSQSLFVQTDIDLSTGNLKLAYPEFFTGAQVSVLTTGRTYQFTVPAETDGGFSAVVAIPEPGSFELWLTLSSFFSSTFLFRRKKPALA